MARKSWLFFFVSHWNIFIWQHPRCEEMKRNDEQRLSQIERWPTTLLTVPSLYTDSSVHSVKPGDPSPKKSVNLCVVGAISSSDFQIFLLVWLSTKPMWSDSGDHRTMAKWIRQQVKHEDARPWRELVREKVLFSTTYCRQPIGQCCFRTTGIALALLRK